MVAITTKDGTQIYYKDWGEGQPVVFSHSWPLSADAWEDQMIFRRDWHFRGDQVPQRGGWYGLMRRRPLPRIAHPE